MTSTPGSYTLVDALIVFVVALFILFTLLTLYRYFFAWQDPLRWNTQARVEAAQNPANLLEADRTFRQQRNTIRGLFWVVLIGALFLFAPVQAQAVIEAVFALLVAVAGIIQGAIV